MKYVAPLSKEVRTTLEEGVRNSKKHHFRNRCRSILMSADGYQVKEIARLFKVRKLTIYTWFDRWEKMGIVGLMVLPGRGLKAKLDHIHEEEIEQIKEAIRANPQSLKQVCKELSLSFGFTITVNMLKGFIKKKFLIAGDDCENA